MSILFLSSFVLGLVLGVFTMLRGVERPPPGSVRDLGIPLAALTSRDALIAATRQIKARYAIPLIGAFLVGFGATGYAIYRLSDAAWWVQLLFAAIVGGLSILGAAGLIAGWAVPSARKDVPDERYILQGRLATVTALMNVTTVGSVELLIDGSVHAFPARGIDDLEIAAGTEVVIERVEADVAYVEPWAHVERRL